MVEELHILEPVDDVAGIAVAPQNNRAVSLRLDVPSEQPRPIASLKPHVFKRQPSEPGPIPICPGSGW